MSVSLLLQIPFHQPLQVAKSTSPSLLPAPAEAASSPRSYGDDGAFHYFEHSPVPPAGTNASPARPSTVYAAGVSQVQPAMHLSPGKTPSHSADGPVEPASPDGSGHTKVPASTSYASPPAALDLHRFASLAQAAEDDFGRYNTHLSLKVSLLLG